jgi:mRNA interferase RelE/StbE
LGSKRRKSPREQQTRTSVTPRVYTIVLTRTAEAGLLALPESDRKRITSAIEGLSHNPRPVGVEKLAGVELYRIRVGNYRIIYEILDDKLLVTVIRIGHRREVYRRLK